MEIGKYTKVEVDGCFNLSPSSLHSWFENPYKWYKNQILKESPFLANTNTVFGSICHAVAEAYHSGEIISKQDVENYVNSFKDKHGVIIDEWYIYDNFPDSREKILKHLGEVPSRDKVEFQTSFSPVDGFSMGGTLDYAYRDVIGDYKTCSSIPSKIKLEHLYQLVTYAICEISKGREVNYVEVTYIRRPDVNGKPSDKTFNKDGTPKIIGIRETQIKVLREPLTDELMQMVKESLKLLIKTVKTYQDNPELADVLFRPNKLSFMQD